VYRLLPLVFLMRTTSYNHCIPLLFPISPPSLLLRLLLLLQQPRSSLLRFRNRTQTGSTLFAFIISFALLTYVCLTHLYLLLLLCCRCAPSMNRKTGGYVACSDTQDKWHQETCRKKNKLESIIVGILLFVRRHHFIMTFATL
jgi:hypothetical protein